MYTVRTLIAGLLCFTISFTTVLPARAATTPSQIAARYPHARVIHIAPEAYPALKQRLEREGYRPAPMQVAAGDRQECVDDTGNTVPCPKPSEKTAQNDRSSVNFGLNLAHSGGSPGGGGGGRGAEAVFVIIGAIVVVVWVLYAAKFLYDLAEGEMPKERWTDLTVATTVSSQDNSLIDNSFRFSGLRYETGFSKDSYDFGLGAELGSSDIHLTEDSGAWLKLKGTYWLLGPVLRWRLHAFPGSVQMRFLGGSTTNDELGVIARATVGLGIRVSKGFHIGFSWGAMNMNLHQDQSVLTEKRHYQTLMGFDMGYQF